MEICNKTHYQQQDFQEQKRNEMKKPTQEVFANGDKAKYDRKQSQALNTILLRVRAPLQRNSNIDETECRRHKVASMSNNRILFRNGDPPTRPREEPDLKSFSHRIDSNKVELNLDQVHHIATSSSFSCSSLDVTLIFVNLIFVFHTFYHLSSTLLKRAVLSSKFYDLSQPKRMVITTLEMHTSQKLVRITALFSGSRNHAKSAVLFYIFITDLSLF